jgi:hypothetical protein
LEESPLQVLKVDIGEVDCLVQAPDKTQRIERAGMLPARCRDFRG